MPALNRRAIINNHRDLQIMNFIIGGVSRSGKTTIAKHICQNYDFNYIPFDSLISTMENLYPGVGIKHGDFNIEFSPVLAEFVGEFLKHISYEDIHTVLDLYQLFPIDYLKIPKISDLRVLYLGYPDLTPEAKLRHVKSHSREKDWTNDFDDDQMCEILKSWIIESRIMKEQCSQSGLPFFDTGSDFSNGISQAINFVEKQISRVSEFCPRRPMIE